MSDTNPNIDALTRNHPLPGGAPRVASLGINVSTSKGLESLFGN